MPNCLVSKTVLLFLQYSKDKKIALFRQIEEKYVKAENVYIIADNARYYRSKKVKEFLENSKIKIIFLPPYSPNLNLIYSYLIQTNCCPISFDKIRKTELIPENSP